MSRRHRSHPHGGRWRRAKRRLAHSIKLRMVVAFVLMALAVTVVFVGGAQRAFTVGWRDAARPLLMDYVDHLAHEVSDADGRPSVERAQALVQRLPLTVRIDGPGLHWQSHPDSRVPDWLHQRLEDADRHGHEDWLRLLRRTTASGHTLEFGVQGDTFERRPRMLLYTLAALLLITLLAWLYVRRLLRPLDAIGAGARRFGAGDFSQPIALRHHHDELSELAQTLNTMGHDIHQMLEAQRALLLAISHELRSPITRARLHAELLPETPDVQPQREALLSNLQEMTHLIADLLESERLSGQHAALHREPVDPAALVREVLHELAARQPDASAALPVVLHTPPDLPLCAIDPTRFRLLCRNLIDNALRHGVADGASAPQAVEVTLTPGPDGLQLEVRDHGPGVPEAQIAQLAQAFYRPDGARSRRDGGVGLGLYLCRLVAQAHGGRFAVRNAHPGLAIHVTLPNGPTAGNGSSQQ